MATQSNKSIEKAIRLLEIVCSEEDCVSLRCIAAKANLSIATTHRLVNTLKEVGALEVAYDGSFRLGGKLIAINSRTEDAIRQARSAVDSSLVHLVEQAGVSARLSLMDEDDLVIVAGMDSGVGDAIRSRIGGRYEAYCTAPGKLLLAALSPAQFSHYVSAGPLVKVTRNTIADPIKLREELARIRLTDYALDDQEYVEGARCIAVPVKGRNAKTVAALSICSQRLAYLDMHKCIPRLRDSAETLSRQFMELPRGVRTLLCTVAMR